MITYFRASTENMFLKENDIHNLILGVNPELCVVWSPMIKLLMRLLAMLVGT